VVVLIVDVGATVVVVASVVVVGGVVVVVVMEVVLVVVVEQLHGGCVVGAPCADAGIAKPTTAALTTPTNVKTRRAEGPCIAPPHSARHIAGGETHGASPFAADVNGCDVSAREGQR
jgi:hypothetical protein